MRSSIYSGRAGSSEERGRHDQLPDQAPGRLAKTGGHGNYRKPSVSIHGRYAETGMQTTRHRCRRRRRGACAVRPSTDRAVLTVGSLP